MKLKYIPIALLGLMTFVSCDENGKEKTENAQKTEQTDKLSDAEFHYTVDEFADIKILRYQIPGWDELSLKKQKLVYYLTQAGLSGRDIIWDQNYKHNLKIRKALENIHANYDGDKNADDWKNFETYLKRVWFF